MSAEAKQGEENGKSPQNEGNFHGKSPKNGWCFVGKSPKNKGSFDRKSPKMLLRKSEMQKKILESKRITYIDVAKGLLILFVVLYHNVLFSDDMSHHQNEIAFFLREFEYYMCAPFFMPAFFVLTGYSSNFNKPFKPFISSLVMAIGCPLFFFDIIPYNIEAFQRLNLTDWLAQIPLTLQRFFRYSLWFLRAYFVAKLLYWVLNKYCKEVTKNIICCILFLLACFAVLSGHGDHGAHSLMALFYISIGKLCKRFNFFDDFKIGKLSVLLYLVLTIILVLVHRGAPYMTSEVIMADIWDVIILPILAISGSMGIVFIAARINENRILEYLGKYSLVIYCVHMLPYLTRLSNFVLDKMGISVDLVTADSVTTILFILSKFIYTVSACCLIAFIIDRPYLRIMMGKRP